MTFGAIVNGIQGALELASSLLSKLSEAGAEADNNFTNKPVQGVSQACSADSDFRGAYSSSKPLTYDADGKAAVKGGVASASGQGHAAIYEGHSGYEGQYGEAEVRAKIAHAEGEGYAFAGETGVGAGGSASISGAAADGSAYLGNKASSYAGVAGKAEAGTASAESEFMIGKDDDFWGVRGKGAASATAAEVGGKVEGAREYDIPFTDWSIKQGGSVGGSVGASAGGGVGGYAGYDSSSQRAGIGGEVTGDLGIGIDLSFDISIGTATDAL